MSKASLRKELAKMDEYQLRQIVLDAYDARKEIKEYFEFFLNPDIRKLNEKYVKELAKELNRTKWGASKARATKIKGAIKNYIGLNPGLDAVVDMLFTTIDMLGQAERYVNFNEAQMKIAPTVLQQILQIANDNLMFDSIVPRVEQLLKSTDFSSYFRRSLASAYEYFTPA